jgi:conjugal transfer mating pair stabilization protein TraN
MDLSEFYAEITPTILNAGAAASNAAARVPACYFGNGQC